MNRPRGGYRLQHVVDGLLVEGGDGVLVVGGDEHDMAAPVRRRATSSAGRAGHLDVEKQDVGRRSSSRRSACTPSAASPTMSSSGHSWPSCSTNWWRSVASSSATMAVGAVMRSPPVRASSAASCHRVVARCSRARPARRTGPPAAHERARSHGPPRSPPARGDPQHGHNVVAAALDRDVDDLPARCASSLRTARCTSGSSSIG